MDSILSDKNIKNALLAVFGFLALFLVAATISQILSYRYLGPGGQILNTVTVSGEGEVLAVPDIASFSFTVMETMSTVAAAQEAATKKTNDAIAFLKSEGIEEKDIKTLAYNVYPEYEYQNAVCPLGASYCPPGRQVLKGYQVSQTVEVKVRDTDTVGELLTGIGGIGVQSVSGVLFTLDDEDAVREEARAEAIADAKEKAERLAKDLGVRLVRVTNFFENNGPEPYPYYGRGGDAFATVAEKGAVLPELPPGENKFISTVTITYEIR